MTVRPQSMLLRFQPAPLTMEVRKGLGVCLEGAAKGLGLALLVLVVLAGCVKVGAQRGKEPAPRPMESGPSLSAQPQVSVFLATREKDGPKVQLTMSAIELSDGAQWINLLRQPAVIGSTQAKNGPLLDRAQVPAGQYGQVRYQISAAVLEQGGRQTALQVPSQPVELALVKPLSLQAGDSISLFLNWDVAASVAKPPSFSPAIGAMGQQVPLTTALAYVTCPEINTVYIIRTDQNRICGSWGISGRPTYLKAIKARNLLYVLAAEQGVIKVIELSSGRLQDQIRVPMMVRPSFMAVDQDGDSAYLLDQATDYVSRVDLASGSLAAQVRVAERLDFAVFLDDQQRLAVSSERAQKVFLLDKATLQSQQTIQVGTDPQGVLSYQQHLYVAGGRANTVSLHNVNNGATLRQAVGLGPSRLLAHDRTIFAANAKGGSIALLLPEQLTVLKEINIGGSPGEMAISTLQNWLYVNDDKGSVAVVDLTGQRLMDRIDLQARPLDIEVIQ